MKYKLNLEEIDGSILLPDSVKNKDVFTDLMKVGILIPVEEEKWPNYGDLYLYKEGYHWHQGIWSDTPYDKERCKKMGWLPAPETKEETENFRRAIKSN